MIKMSKFLRISIKYSFKSYILIKNALLFIILYKIIDANNNYYSSFRLLVIYENVSKKINDKTQLMTRIFLNYCYLNLLKVLIIMG